MSILKWGSYGISPMLGAQPAVIERISKAQDIVWADYTNADTILVFKLPVNVKILDAGIMCEDCDNGTDAVFELDITDGTTSYAVLGTSAILQTGGLDSLKFNSEGTTAVTEGTSALGAVTDNNDYEMIATVTAKGATTEGDVRFFVKYTNVLEAGESS